MRQQLLLLEDVDGLGRSGDVITPPKAGFVRNFLLPQKKAVIAGNQTLKMQASLKEAREKKALVDRKEGEELAKKIKELVITTEVKIDPEGKMYGSVSALDISRLLQDKGYQLERKNIAILQPLKTLGTHTIPLKLKEGVTGSFTLEIRPEGGIFPKKQSASLTEPVEQQTEAIAKAEET